MINRKEEIKKKGFQMTFRDSAPEVDTQNTFTPVDFSKIKVGTKTLEDAVLDLGNYHKIDNKRLSNKEMILRALHENSYIDMREISRFFFETSGIYSRLCKYMAYMYRYD